MILMNFSLSSAFCICETKRKVFPMKFYFSLLRHDTDEIAMKIYFDRDF